MLIALLPDYEEAVCSSSPPPHPPFFNALRGGGAFDILFTHVGIVERIVVRTGVCLRAIVCVCQEFYQCGEGITELHIRKVNYVKPIPLAARSKA